MNTRSKQRSRNGNGVQIVVFVTGLLSSPSGGDIHALRLAEHWAKTRGPVCVIGPSQLRKVVGDVPDLKLVTPVVPLERTLTKHMATYPILCLARAIMYAIGAPRAEWYVASSHFLGDVLACVLCRSRNNSLAVYVHHIIKQTHRHPGLRTLLSLGQEALCLFLIRSFACVFVSDPNATDWLLSHRFETNTIHQCRNGSSPPGGVILPSRTSPPSLLFIGRLTKEKGALDFVKIAHELIKAGTLISVDVVGDGPLRFEMESLALRLNLTITFHGYVSEIDKWSLMGRANIVLAPTYEEGWGIAVDEALWAGAEVVCYDLPVFGRVKDLVHSVPVGDVGAAAEKARTLIEQPLPRRARRYLGNRLLTWTAVVEEESMVLEYHHEEQLQ